MAGKWKPGVPAPERKDVALLSDAKKAANKALAAAKVKEEEAAKLSTLKKRLKDLESTQKKAKADITAYDNAIKDFQTRIINLCKLSTPYLTPYGPRTPNAVEAQQILDWSKAIDVRVALKKTLANQHKTASDQIASINSDIYKLTHLSTSHITPKVKSNNNNNNASNGADGLVPPPQPNADEVVYEYNAPMIKTGYLNPFGPQGNAVADKKSMASPTFQNARNAWKDAVPSRGTIQTSKVFAASFPTAKPTKTKGRRKSEQPCGFRFLYNPTDVSMAWGIVDAFSPEYAQSGSNGMSGVAIGLMKGVISFSLLLNRIGDMNYLNQYGLMTSVDTSAFVPGVDPAQRNSAYNKAYAASNPYPETVSIEDQQSIYTRGTMYDLEYLFRAMGGPYAQYESGLNGLTADAGWLQPIPLELHLGAGLRYLVRVSSLDVKHIMFNDRMVPTLSTVNLTCTRYYDSPDAFDNSWYAPESATN
jgi:hypothetical protein